MANVDAAYGLALHEDNSQSNLITCIIPSGNVTATFVGDAVKLLDADAAKINGGPYAPAVAQAAATDPIFGVVMGFQQHTVASGMDLGRRHRPASTAMYALVKPAHPLDVYRMQADDDTETLTAASIGCNADLIVGSGSTITGLSAMEVDSSSAAATAGLQLRIIGFVDKPSNEVGAANQDVLVCINQSQTFNESGAAGVAE
jgi:hypothetical protein